MGAAGGLDIVCTAHMQSHDHRHQVPRARVTGELCSGRSVWRLCRALRSSDTVQGRGSEWGCLASC